MMANRKIAISDSSTSFLELRKARGVVVNAANLMF